MLIPLICCLPFPGGQQQTPDDPLLLPFSTSDAVIVLDAETGRRQALTGVIEDLVGDRVLLRRGGAGRVDTIRLREIETLQFLKSPLFDDGLKLMRAGKWQSAVDLLDQASIAEPRQWVKREIDAEAARGDFALRRFEQVIVRVERIFERDPLTRHINLLPLVWDERMPEAERFTVAPAELAAQSPIRRLCAASASLHLPEFRGPAESALAELRTSGLPGIQELATAQLWRLPILDDLPLRPGKLQLWVNRADSFDFWLRGGPLAVIGRLQLRGHDYDSAANSLLWFPVMQGTDRGLAAACQVQAAIAARQSGRPDEAQRLLNEARLRFPDCGAVRELSQP
jgi:hypothetical protein